MNFSGVPPVQVMALVDLIEMMHAPEIICSNLHRAPPVLPFPPAAQAISNFCPVMSPTHHSSASGDELVVVMIPRNDNGPLPVFTRLRELEGCHGHITECWKSEG